MQQISLTSVNPASSFLRATFGKILVLIPQIASPVGHEVSEDQSPESYLNHIDKGKWYDSGEWSSKTSCPTRHEVSEDQSPESYHFPLSS